MWSCLPSERIATISKDFYILVFPLQNYTASGQSQDFSSQQPDITTPTRFNMDTGRDASSRSTQALVFETLGLLFASPAGSDFIRTSEGLRLVVVVLVVLWTMAVGSSLGLQ